MLSRTAENLFWMARDMERAENTARMLDVSFRIADMLSAIADGGIILSKVVKDKDVLPRQVMLYRDFVRDLPRDVSERSGYSAASLTYSPLPTGQAAHSSSSAVIRVAISASVCTGEGVKRMRSVPRVTVG